MTSGKFYVDPEILSPQVKKGQEVIWSENNPSHDIYRVLEFYLELENSWAGFG